MITWYHVDKMGKLQVKERNLACGAGCDLCVDEDRLEAWMAVAKQSRPVFKRLDVRPVDRVALAIERQESQFADVLE